MLLFVEEMLKLILRCNSIYCEHVSITNEQRRHWSHYTRHQDAARCSFFVKLHIAQTYALNLPPGRQTSVASFRTLPARLLSRILRLRRLSTPLLPETADQIQHALLFFVVPFQSRLPRPCFSFAS